MRHIVIFFILFITISQKPFSQTVKTFAQVPSNGDVAIDKNGYVYTVSENSIIKRISPDGDVESTPFATGNTINRGTGLAFDPDGETLYVTCRPLNGQGYISRIEPNGTESIFCSGLFFPGDISFDQSGHMYVTEFNNNVSRISPSGERSIYVNSGLFNTPIGIAWTPGDTIYVASAHDGNIYQVLPTQPQRTVKWFARVDGLQQAWACGFMTYWKGALFITNGDNIIHRISLDGVVSDFAGTGQPGWIDGPAHSCRFEAPNGIGVGLNSDKMYVTEYGLSRVREIDPEITSNTNFKDEDAILYPVPATDILKIKGEQPLGVDIISNDGSVIKHSGAFNQIDIRSLTAGSYFINLRYRDRVIGQKFTKI